MLIQKMLLVACGVLNVSTLANAATIYATSTENTGQQEWQTLAFDGDGLLLRAVATSDDLGQPSRRLPTDYYFDERRARLHIAVGLLLSADVTSETVTSMTNGDSVDAIGVSSRGFPVLNQYGCGYSTCSSFISSVDPLMNLDRFALGSPARKGRILLDADDRIFFTHPDLRDVQLFDTVENVWRPFATGLTTPSDLAFSPNGELYVVQREPGTIVRFDMSGNPLGVFASGFDKPTDIDFDENQNLYVASAGTMTIDRVTPDGQVEQGVIQNVIGPIAVSPDWLQAGDADQDLDFDQEDIVRVVQAGRYLTGEAANWAEGDWNGAPGGIPGHPPVGDGVFDQLDIIAALTNGSYMVSDTRRFAGLAPSGEPNDATPSVIYDAATGEVAIDPPLETRLTSVNIVSDAGVFTGVDYDPRACFECISPPGHSLFKATFGTSFGFHSFGMVAERELSEDFLRSDLSVFGSLLGGGELRDVDLVYVAIPEPTSLALFSAALFIMLAVRPLARLLAL